MKRWIKNTVFMYTKIRQTVSSIAVYGYEEWLTIERIDVNGDYSPENCKFITMSEQAKNKRNVLLTVNGITKTKGEWCAEYNINLRTLSSRLNKLNWSPERAVLTPVRRRNG